MQTETQLDAMTIEEIVTAKSGVEGLHKKMKFLPTLSEEVRNEHRALKFGSKKLRHVEKRLTAALSHREQLPSSFDLPKFERDGTLALALGDCLESIDRLYTAVRDTLLVVGSRALASSLQAQVYLRVADSGSGKRQSGTGSIAPRRSRTAAQTVAPQAADQPAQPAVALPEVKVIADEPSKAA